MKHYSSIKPTESELEILCVLWELQKATVRMVHEALSLNKSCGYTTTLKLMQIMHEKKLVKRDDSAKSHVYEAAVSKEQTQQNLVSNMIQRLFSGSGSQLALQALGSQKPSPEEIVMIEKLLSTLKANQK
jgi:BlaI family penicillinase repressor